MNIQFLSDTTYPVFEKVLPPQPEMHTCVVIPVGNNGADNLWQTLDSLRSQTDLTGKPLSFNAYEVLLLASNSTKKTIRIATEFQERYPDFKLHIDKVTLPEHLAKTGTVRRILMNEAYRRFMLNGNVNGVIASIDSDTVIDSQWLHYIMAEIACGNDVVCGQALSLNLANSTRDCHAHDTMYRYLLAKAEALLAPKEYTLMLQDFQPFEASVAVTCDIYQRVCCSPNTNGFEDDTFYQALAKHNARIKKSFNVKVYTTAHLQDMVSLSFYEQFSNWNANQQSGCKQLVEPVAQHLVKFYVRKQLHNCWNNRWQQKNRLQQELSEIAALIRQNTEWLYFQLHNFQYFGVFWSHVEQTIHRQLQWKHHPSQNIEDAIQELSFFIKEYPTAGFQINLNGTFRHSTKLSA